VLREVGLEAAVAKYDGFESSRNWHDVLALEDEQLMAVARALLAHPTFAFLDHLESALSDEARIHVLNLMAKHDITCVSISDGKPDPAVHDACLELREDGSWKWTDLR
jgi:putative ATP-binding cassette transporter